MKERTADGCRKEIFREQVEEGKENRKNKRPYRQVKKKKKRAKPIEYTGKKKRVPVISRREREGRRDQKSLASQKEKSLASQKG